MDFCERMYEHDLNRRVLESLIKAGAFDRMGYRRAQLLLIYGQVLDGIAANRKRNVEGQLDLFGMGAEEGAAAPVETFHLPDVPELALQDMMNMEKETTGLYLSGHPMDQYRDAARAHGAVTIASILMDFTREDGPASFRDGQRVSVAGVITTYRSRTTKNNTLMAYVNLEDDTAAMELLCFSRVLEESGGYIRENAPIFATGRISVRDEKAPQLMVDSLRPLSDLDEEVAAGGNETLYLRLPSREDPKLRKVQLALSFFPGHSNAVLYFEDCKKRVGTQCQIHPALVQDLKERLGAENVVVQEPQRNR
jgi:DNA polymerase-3 subunit alpha